MAFTMPIEDVFEVKDRGVIVVGTIASGEVKRGDAAEVHTPTQILPTQIRGIERFGIAIHATAGDNVALLISGISKNEIPPGSEIRAR